MYNLLLSIAFSFLCLNAVIVCGHPADLEAELQDANEEQFLGQFVQEQDQDANEQLSHRRIKLDQLQEQDQISHEEMQATDQEVKDSDDLATDQEDVQATDQEVKDSDDLATDQEDMEANEQGGTIRVIFAYYGVSCARGYINKVNQARSTNYASRRCNGRTKCRALVSTGYLTDPYRGCRKNFLVVAKCSNGKIISSLVRPEAHGRYFSLSCC